MVVSLIVGPGHCGNKPRLVWSSDHHFANLRPTSSFPPDAQLTGTESLCVSRCSDTQWCSSFFFRRSIGICNMYKTVFTEKDRLIRSVGNAYFRIKSGE